MPSFAASDDRTLLLMRHAKSSWDNPAWSDHERPLNERGRRDAPRMGKLLERQGMRPSLIVASTAARARETAERLAEACEYAGEIVLEAALYHATPDDWNGVLRQLPSEHHRVLCVGHNPGLEELLRRWSGEAVEMPTAAVAIADGRAADWREFAGHVVEVSTVYRPKEIDDGSET